MGSSCGRVTASNRWCRTWAVSGESWMEEIRSPDGPRRPPRPCALATVVFRPACSCEIAEWPFCFRAIHGIGSPSSVKDGFWAASGPLTSPPSFAFAFHCLHLPVLPSTRRFWPPQRSVQHSRVAWQKRICSGKCHRADLQRGRGQGVHERDASRPRHHTFPQKRRTPCGSHCGGFDVVWWPVGHRRHCGLAIARWWHTPTKGGHHWWAGTGGGTQAQGKNIARVVPWECARCWWVIASQVGGRWSQETKDFWVVVQLCRWRILCVRSLSQKMSVVVSQSW